MTMGYQEALQAAGAHIKEYEHFGDYQGTWMALTEDNKVVEGSYGSCSGCDAFEAEFGWSDEDKPDYQERLVAFGKSYLGGEETLDEAIARYERKDLWFDEKQALEWLKEMKKKYGKKREGI